MDRPNSPENPLTQFILPENLKDPAQPLQLPEGTSKILGGIGLGEIKENETLGSNTSVEPNTEEEKYDFFPKSSNITMKSLIDILEEDFKKELTKEQCRVLYGIDVAEPSDYENSSLALVKAKRSGRQELDIALALDLEEFQITSYSGVWLKNQDRIVCLLGELDLWNLTSAENTKLPKLISKTLNLGSLKSAKGLCLPHYIGEELILSDLEVLEEPLTLPRFVGQYLDMSKLTSAEGVTFPDYIGSTLALNSLNSLKGLDSVLESHEGTLTLPQKLQPALQAQNLQINPDLTIRWEAHE